MLDISSTKTTELVSLTLLDLTDLLTQDAKLGIKEIVLSVLLDGYSIPTEFVLP